VLSDMQRAARSKDTILPVCSHFFALNLNRIKTGIIAIKIIVIEIENYKTVLLVGYKEITVLLLCVISLPKKYFRTIFM
jgi:hypothetical protein